MAHNRSMIKRHLPPFPRTKTLVHRYRHVQTPGESYFPHRYLPATPKNQLPFRRYPGGPRMPKPPSCIPKYGPNSGQIASRNSSAACLFRNQSLDSGYEPSRRHSQQYQQAKWAPRQLPVRPDKPKYNPEAPWESSVEDDWTTIQNDSLDSYDNNQRNYCSDYENYGRWQSDNEASASHSRGHVGSAAGSSQKSKNLPMSPGLGQTLRPSQLDQPQSSAQNEEQSRQASFESQSSGIYDVSRQSSQDSQHSPGQKTQKMYNQNYLRPSDIPNMVLEKQSSSQQSRVRISKPVRQKRIDMSPTCAKFISSPLAKNPGDKKTAVNLEASTRSLPPYDLETLGRSLSSEASSTKSDGAMQTATATATTSLYSGAGSNLSTVGSGTSSYLSPNCSPPNSLRRFAPEVSVPVPAASPLSPMAAPLLSPLPQKRIPHLDTNFATLGVVSGTAGGTKTKLLISRGNNLASSTQGGTSAFIANPQIQTSPPSNSFVTAPPGLLKPTSHVHEEWC